MVRAGRGYEVKPHPAARFVGISVNKQGNLLALRRRNVGRSGGATTPEFSTGVNPMPSVTPGSVYLPRG
jgi:hypothetical protein